MRYGLYVTYSLAGRLGIEPRFTASKAAVLPLDDLPLLLTFCYQYFYKLCFVPVYNTRNWRKKKGLVFAQKSHNPAR